jgi:hypothetical protein
MHSEEESTIKLLLSLFPNLSVEEMRDIDHALGRYVAIALRVFDDLESCCALTEEKGGRNMERQRSNITNQVHENS